MGLNNTLQSVNQNALQLCLLALLILSFSGCSSKPAVSPEQQLESQWNTINNESVYSISSVRSFAKQAQAQQNWELVWKSQLLLCQSEQSISAKSLACDRALFAVNLLNNSDPLLFKTMLTRYLHLGDMGALTKAKKLVNTDQQQAQLWLAQNRIPNEELLSSIDRNSAEYAQYLYLQGKANNNLGLLEQSIEISKALNHLHKVAEVLFVKGKIEFQSGKLDAARRSSSESLLILDNLKSEEPYRLVKEWYDDRLPAR